MIKKLFNLFKRAPRLPQVGDVYGDEMWGAPYDVIKVISINKENPYLIEYFYLKCGITYLTVMGSILTKDIRELSYLKFIGNGVVKKDNTMINSLFRIFRKGLKKHSKWKIYIDSKVEPESIWRNLRTDIQKGTLKK